MLSKKEIINNELELLEDPASKWFYNDLKLLVNLDNHRYTFDGYEYVWESNIKHWTKDLEKLNRIKANEDRNAAKVLEKIVDREFKAVIKISKKKLKPIKKVQLILEVKSELDNATICKALGLSKRTFYRYIDKINKIN